MHMDRISLIKKRSDGVLSQLCLLETFWKMYWHYKVHKQYNKIVKIIKYQ